METALSCQAARALVSAYMNHELDAEHAHALESHIQGCTSCPALYASLVAVQQRLRASPRPTLSPEDVLRLAERVSEALREGEDFPPSSAGPATAFQGQTQQTAESPAPDGNGGSGSLAGNSQ